jgi:glycosyltransferase involved in cell wall biosynthesis
LKKIKRHKKKKSTYGLFIKKDRLPDASVEGALKKTISLCMIVKNEENDLERCLRSVKAIVDEIIVVDTGSSDNTKEIAKKFEAKIFDFKWNNSFADARNFSLSKATGQWILVLDADEVISTVDRERLRRVVLDAGSTQIAYAMITRNYISSTAAVGWISNDGTYAAEEAGSGWVPSEKVRLFPNDNRIRFVGPIHEMVEHSLLRLGIEVKKCDIPVHHYGKLNKEKTRTKWEEYYALGKKKLVQLGEHDIKNIYEIAVQALELGRYEEALEYWKKLAALRPDFSDAFFYMGITYFQLGMLEQALLTLEKALQIDPASADVVTVYSKYQIISGHAERSILYLEKLLDKYPSDPKALAALAVAYLCTGRKDKGLACINTLRDMSVDLRNYFSENAKALISAGEIKYAMLLLEAAVESNSINSETLTLLAQCYQRSQ